MDDDTGPHEHAGLGTGVKADQNADYDDRQHQAVEALTGRISLVAESLFEQAHDCPLANRNMPPPHSRVSPSLQSGFGLTRGPQAKSAYPKSRRCPSAPPACAGTRWWSWVSLLRYGRAHQSGEK